MPSASESSSNSSNSPQTEKPQHYMYLKEFRTQQCELFLQHKCQQHRPFTCFNWHFLNQRRRRPVKKRDGTFSYSPDIYCTKYDETTGICPDGDDCPFLHRTAGDTERRYHLRYYKTGTCVYETDSKGNCTKNGPHCAFAHGVHDMRPPVYDSTELVPSMEILDKSLSSSLEKDKVLAEDPRWNDTNFVLANYKTEPCKRPPRLCRQGYACPQFHNTRDRRRSPKQFKYRSTPCPNVKHGDEWGDPTQCESGDSCSYCHTRTEQQFHPEIYKSTKCNDMVQTNTCPRGPFCAFAHVEHEITSVRDILSSLSSNSLAAFVTNVLPQVDSSNKQDQKSDTFSQETNGSSETKLPDPIGKERTSSTSSQSSLIPMSLLTNNSSSNGSSFRSSPLSDPFTKTRSYSFSSDYSISPLYMRAPGYERDEIQLKLRQQLLAIEKDPSLEPAEKQKQKESLLLVHQSGLFHHLSHGLASSSLGSTMMSPLAPSFYPTGECVESVLGKALDEGHMDDLDISSLERELDKDMDSNSVSSSLSAGFSTSGCFSNSSIPIGIPPGSLVQRGSISSLSQSPPSPFGSFPHSLQPLHLQKQDSHDHSSSPLLSCYSGLSKYQMCSNLSDTNSMSPRSAGPQSPLLSGSFGSHLQNGELLKLRDELLIAKSKMAEWEGVYNQAKCACDAWKKEAEDAKKRAKVAEEDKHLAVKQKDEMFSQNLQMKQIISLSGGPHIYALSRTSEMDKLSGQQLQHLKHQLQEDLDLVNKMICQKVQRAV